MQIVLRAWRVRICDMNTTSRYAPLERSRRAVASEPACPVPRTPLVEIVIPVYNEQEVLASSVRELRDYLHRNFSFSFQITVADNASTDATLQIATGRSRSRAASRLELQLCRCGGLHGRRSVD